ACNTRIESTKANVSPTYTVVVTETGWNVSGNISVVNPNDWEDVLVNLSDALNLTGAPCTITGGTAQVVPRSSSISPAYSCTFASAPSATSGTNTATGSWDDTAWYTPDNSAFGLAGFSFGSLTVTDTINGTTKTLGTIAGNAPSTT